MNIAEQEIDKMYVWIVDKMKFDKWYPVQSEKAYEILMILFKEGLINNCEFDQNETHIRKVNLNL